MYMFPFPFPFNVFDLDDKEIDEFFDILEEGVGRWLKQYDDMQKSLEEARKLLDEAIKKSPIDRKKVGDAFDVLDKAIDKAKANPFPEDDK